MASIAGDAHTICQPSDDGWDKWRDNREYDDDDDNCIITLIRGQETKKNTARIRCVKGDMESVSRGDSGER